MKARGLNCSKEKKNATSTRSAGNAQDHVFVLDGDFRCLSHFCDGLVK